MKFWILYKLLVTRKVWNKLNWNVRNNRNLLIELQKRSLNKLCNFLKWKSWVIENELLNKQSEEVFRDAQFLIKFNLNFSMF